VSREELGFDTTAGCYSGLVAIESFLHINVSDMSRNI
jgi:hypothetical protein